MTVLPLLAAAAAAALTHLLTRLAGRTLAHRPDAALAWVLTAVAAAGAAGLGVGWGPGWALGLGVYLVAVTVTLTWTDLARRRLPDVVVLPVYPVAGVALSVAALLEADPGLLVRAAIGGVGVFAALYVLALAVPAGLGFGDVKLSGVLAALAASISWAHLGVMLVSAFALGAVWALGALVRADRAGVPFGPALLAGLWIAVSAGDQLAHAYARLTGLA